MDSMIIWTGMFNNTVHYRVLGSQDINGTSLYSVPRSPIRPLLLSHNEGTTLKNGTSPSIGTGEVKLLRDSAVRGYTAGVNIDNINSSPTLIDRTEHHILA